ncbi:MAG: hypothetical protein VX541_03070, partial [Candidatus Poribacteria bacterium]|nr:hypothetical protein [Candidatus Poribacteria bacterium]
MIFGFGKYSYEVEEGWLAQSNNQEMGWIPAVACDSKDNVYVYSRNDHPLVVYNRQGDMLEVWGEGILEPKTAHGIFIDLNDNVYCTDASTHCVHKFDSE